MLPIGTHAKGLPEIHYTRISRRFRRWQAAGCMDAIFAGSVSRLHDDQLPDLTVIHGDGTTTVAKKGGDHLGYSGHKHLRGDKAVALCDRHCNVIAPFVTAAGNRNESPRLREALPRLSQCQSKKSCYPLPGREPPGTPASQRNDPVECRNFASILIELKLRHS
jgi:hypothetical protein